jgi:hypothetical protein
MPAWAESKKTSEYLSPFIPSTHLPKVESVSKDYSDGLQAELTTDRTSKHRTRTMRSPLADLVGKSDDVAAERLPPERMKKYYPAGVLPPNAARYRPIPDSWASAYPLTPLIPTGRAMTPDELARYQAKSDKAFYSCAHLFGMTMEEVIDEVHLRHIWACYLANLGISRAKYDEELNRYGDINVNNRRPSPYANISVEELKNMEMPKVVEPLLTMLFRNLLLYRAEDALPEGHETWRSGFVKPHPAILEGGEKEAHLRSRKEKAEVTAESSTTGKGKGKDVKGGRTPRKNKQMLGYAC